MFWGSAWRSAANCCMGAAMAPANWASRTSRGAISARLEISSTVSRCWSSRPPFITSESLALAKSLRALAKATGSPAEPSGCSPVKAMAVGPVSRSPRSRPSSSIAKRARVFLYTLYSPPASRRDRRSAANAGTSSPRYSVSTTALLVENFSWTSSTTATFSARGSPTLTPPPSSSRSVAVLPPRPISVAASGRSRPHAPSTGAGPVARIRSGGLPCSGGVDAVILGSDGAESRSAPGRNPEVFGERVDCGGQDIGGTPERHPRPDRGASRATTRPPAADRFGCPGPSSRTPTPSSDSGPWPKRASDALVPR